MPDSRQRRARAAAPPGAGLRTRLRTHGGRLRARALVPGNAGAQRRLGLRADRRSAAVVDLSLHVRGAPADAARLTPTARIVDSDEPHAQPHGRAAAHSAPARRTAGRPQLQRPRQPRGSADLSDRSQRLRGMECL